MSLFYIVECDVCGASCASGERAFEAGWRQVRLYGDSVKHYDACSQICASRLLARDEGSSVEVEPYPEVRS